MRRLVRLLSAFLLAAMPAGLIFATSAHAQQRVIPCYASASVPMGGSDCTSVSVANPLPVSATVTATATTTATAAATPPTVSAGAGLPLIIDLHSSLFVQPTFAGTPVDGTHGLPINCIVGCAGGTASNATSGVATSSTNGTTDAWLYGFNGTTWDQLQVDGSKFLKVVLPANQSVNTAQVNGVTTLTGTGAVGTGSQRVAVGTDAATIAGSAPGTSGTPSTNVLSVQGTTTMTPILQAPTSQYPNGAVPITASATGTTGATTATLAASASIKTYICGFSIRANATAAATANSTVTGTITATMNFTQWTAPLASGIGLTEMAFTPCVPSSAINTGVAVISAAPGSGGVVSVSAWGYQL